MRDESKRKRAGKAPPPRPRQRTRRSIEARPKLADVARVAVVSTATASRAINAPETVSEATRARVQAAIKQLNWIPHGAAKALASLRTRTIGALIPNLGHQSISAMLEALQNELAVKGYTLILGRPDASSERSVLQATKMLEHGIECLVLMGEDQPQPLLDLLEQRGIFHVFAYTSGRLGRPNCIGFDNFLEMGRLVRHLLDLGHRRFALVTRNFENNDRIRQRVEAVDQVLAEVGIAVRPQHRVIVSSWGIGSGREGMQRILATPMRPTAVVCANDYLAAGALIEAKAAGLAVPRDVSIVGFDDLELASQLDPPLTTIRVPAAETGAEIARFIMRRLESGVTKLPERLHAELMVRGSTGRPGRAKTD